MRIHKAIALLPLCLLSCESATLQSFEKVDDDWVMDDDFPDDDQFFDPGWSVLGQARLLESSHYPSVSMTLDGSMVAGGGGSSRDGKPCRIEAYTFVPQAQIWIPFGTPIVQASGTDCSFAVNDKTIVTSVRDRKLQTSHSVVQLWMLLRSYGSFGTRVVWDNHSANLTPGNYRNASENDWFGYSVDVATTSAKDYEYFVAVGSNHASGGYAEVYLFRASRFIGEWERVGAPIDTKQAFPKVKLSSNGEIVAIMTSSRDQHHWTQCQISVYRLDKASAHWKQMGQTISFDICSDTFSFSPNGHTLACGTRVFRKKFTKGEPKGHVQVWEYSSMSDYWGQKGRYLDTAVEMPSLHKDFNFGTTTALSADGNRVVVLTEAGTEHSQIQLTYIVTLDYVKYSWVRNKGELRDTRGPVALSGDASILLTGEGTYQDDELGAITAEKIE